MTDEQREEKNRKRREAYRRKKSYANKENEPGCNIHVFKSSNADTNIAKHPTGISGLRRESDRALSDLNSNDKRLETNKKMREAYPMKKDVTKGAKISSDLNFKDGAAEEHAHISSTVQLLPANDLNFNDGADEQHIECVSCTAPTNEHPPTDDENDAPITSTPIVEHPADSTPVGTVESNLSDAYTDVPPVIGYTHLPACADTSSVSVKSCKTRTLTDDQRARKNKRRRELYHEKNQSKKQTKTGAERNRDYKRRLKDFWENNLHPESIALENPQFTPEIILPTRVNPN
ncbi:hypothetical protein PVAP13_2KG382100 [Panicum virgatum]|nr:hypothetical protein PVAP13_2KG382100 [Panicum virgatum]